MKQAIGYVRRSTDRQEESLEQQEAKLRSFAEAKGWTLKAVYVDDAISGSELKRPGLEQLLHEAKMASDVDVVIAWDRNRLARPKDPMDGMLLERELIQAGKQVFYASNGMQADRSFTSGLLGYIEHFQNGDYLRKLSRNTIRGIVARVERGLWPGGPIPFGYDRLILDADKTPRRIVRDMEDGTHAIFDPNTGELVEQLPKGRRHKKQDHELCTLIPSTPERIRALQQMFADFAAGKATRTIRDSINKAGFRTSRGSMFTPQTILPILSNPAYLGKCVYNRRTESKWHRYTKGNSVERQDEGLEARPAEDQIVVDDAWEALVDSDTFDSVQRRREESKQHKRHTTGTAIRAEYLLTGLMFCGVCGHRLTGYTKTSGKGIRTPYYVCSSHHSGRHDICPDRYTVPAKPVETHILELIERDLAKLRDDDKLHQYVAQELERITGGKSDAREQLQRQLIKTEQKLAAYREHLAELDAVTARGIGLYDQVRDLNEQKAIIEAELASAREDCPELPDASELRRRASEAFDNLQAVFAGGTIEERRELISHYVQKIEADPHSETVQISLYPALVSRKIAVGGFEPPTSGL